MKTCIKCGSNNPDCNKYCSECGTNLSDNSKGNMVICKNCGSKNNLQANFCLNCGAELIKQQNPSAHIKRKSIKRNIKSDKRTEKKLSHKNYSHRKSILVGQFKNVWVISIIIILSVGIAGSFDLLFHKYNTYQPAITEMKAVDPLIKSQVYTVASNFECACGKCSDSLNVCDCDVAVQERNFITKNLEKGKKPDQVALEINKKYGGLVTNSL